MNVHKNIRTTHRLQHKSRVNVSMDTILILEIIMPFHGRRVAWYHVSGKERRKITSADYQNGKESSTQRCIQGESNHIFFSIYLIRDLTISCISMVRRKLRVSRRKATWRLKITEILQKWILAQERLTSTSLHRHDFFPNMHIIQQKGWIECSSMDARLFLVSIMAFCVEDMTLHM